MLNRLLANPTGVSDQTRRRRRLNGLLLTFTGIGVVLIVLTAVFNTVLGNLLPVTLLTTLCFAGLYLLSRQGWTTAAMLGLLVVLTLAVLGGTVLSGLPVEAQLIYPALWVLVILTAGVFLSWRWVAVTVVVLSVVAAGFYFSDVYAPFREYRVTHADTVNVAALILIALFLAVGTLSWLSNLIIEETLRDLRGRNQELQEANADLLQQSEREHQLGADIGDLASSLSAVSARQVTGVAQQSRAINQVVSTVAELHNAADQIAALAQEVNYAADQALHAVQRAQDMVLRSREAVARNRVQVQQVIERMTALERLTERLTGFVNSIRDLSDETQLLALNATIEAAGAGALGRRFGVVAAEVQNLSNRSNSIVDQIRELISELARAGQVTLAATQSSIAVANEVEGLADEVRGTQEQVVQAVQRTSELVHLISTATTQQTSATQQVTHTMGEIVQVSDMTNQDSAALEQAITDLGQAARQLNTAMTRLHPASVGVAPAPHNGAH